ncbi:MAG: adenosylcobinamide-GDP ribazoletransferase [Nitrospirae bacterium]|nr:adenosylcobinamide-GDP ribazoletransferase [Nitrospirota bacterium]
MFKHFLIALQFLTIFPVKVKGDITENDMARASVYFPVAGAFQGILVMLATMLLSRVFSTEVTSGIIVIVLIISNGGFHLDGISDTFDALAVKSSGIREADRERRLEVMKDSRTGAIGVTALVLTILLKYLLIDNLLLYSASITRYSLLFLMPVFSKWLMVPAMYHGTSARKDGLGRIFIENINRKDLVYSTLITFSFVLLVAKLLQNTAYSRVTAFLLIILFAVIYIFCLLSVRFCRRMFGGLTGDTLGALGEITEIMFLMVAALWLQHSI